MSVVRHCSAIGARALVCIITIAGVAAVTPVQAQKKPQFYTATVTFTDAPTSSSVPGEVRLTGDSTGNSYPAMATITAAGGGTLGLDLTRSTRRLQVTLKDGAAITGPLPSGTQAGASGVTYELAASFTVLDVRAVTVGSSVLRDLNMVVDGISRGYRLKMYPAGGVGTRVCVTRTGATTWRVSTLVAGDACGGDLSAGETARLVDQRTSASVQLGTYLMPFSFDVNCPTCQ